MKFPTMADKVKKEEGCTLNGTGPGAEEIVESSFEAGDECAGVLDCKYTVQRLLGRWGGV